MTELKTLGVKVGESCEVSAVSLPPQALRSHATNKGNGLVDARLAFLRDQSDIDVRRDLEIVPL